MNLSQLATARNSAITVLNWTKTLPGDHTSDMNKVTAYLQIIKKLSLHTEPAADHH
jgi:hypothetical protein